MKNKTDISFQIYCNLKAAKAKIFIRKILCLIVEKRLWFVIKYVILKQTPLILKTLPLEYS